MCKDPKQRPGASLKNKQAHTEDHRSWSRRSFLQNLGLVGGAGLAFGGMSISAMSSPALLPMLSQQGVDDRILVLIRLKGGNDGLNTIIPTFDYGTYQAARPSIAIPSSQIIDLNDEFGMQSSMESLLPLWNEGQMKVINTVGYDNHNLSHFNSSDIWNSARTDIGISDDQSGWLGRYILNQDPDYLENLPEIPAAIKVSSGSSITYNNAEQIDLAVNFNSPDRLLQIAETGLVYDTVNLPDDCYYGEQVGFLRSVMNVTFNYAPHISTAYNAVENAVEYNNDELSRQLAIVARLIKGGLGTKLFMVTLNGFDTHENQNNTHPQLMNSLSQAVNAFYADLSASGQNQQVLSMTFSEFGRRIQENQGGTDHGTAAPVMLFGPALNGNGILGDAPDLSNTDANGNLLHSTDFRSIYATILESWLCLEASSVDALLGQSFTRLDELGLDCIEGVGTNNLPLKQGIQHAVRINGAGDPVIMYQLDRPGQIELSVYTILGQKISTLFSGYQSAGKHEALFISPFRSISSAALVYRILADGKLYGGKMMALK